LRRLPPVFRLASPLAVVAGSGFYAWNGLEHSQETVLSTPYGEASAPVVQGLLSGRQVLFMTRHGREHSLAPHRINYRANIWALREAGAKTFLVINCAGGIKDVLTTPGCVCAPDQLLDLTWGRETSFFAEDRIRHVDMTDPCDAALRNSLLKTEADFDFYRGGCCYATTQGPRLETRAEIDYLERIGADLVGMTAMPEVALVRELGLPVAILSLIVNAAAGRGQVPLQERDMRIALERGMLKIQTFVSTWLADT